MDSSIAKIQNTPYTSIKVDTNRIEAIAFDPSIKVSRPGKTASAIRSLGFEAARALVVDGYLAGHIEGSNEALAELGHSSSVYEKYANELFLEGIQIEYFKGAGMRGVQSTLPAISEMVEEARLRDEEVLSRINSE
jgi:hypothetical protein